MKAKAKVKMTTTKRTETATTAPSLASSRICPVHFHGSPRALFALSLLFSRGLRSRLRLRLRLRRSLAYFNYISLLFYFYRILNFFWCCQPMCQPRTPRRFSRFSRLTSINQTTENNNYMQVAPCRHLLLLLPCVRWRSMLPTNVPLPCCP